ncbi:hypothetical protein HK105_202356 [Polyrhizophydium stewartii]|uniref:RNA polymerase II-associated protein 3 n=1 Tax=Polyrhizophydium stewartii TaxID=2732419 RepID=A0ABR4NEJ8_9FUNG
MEAALRVRRNAEEYRESVSDLLSWEKQMQKQDTAAKKAHARTGGMRMPPVRARGDIATAAAAEAASQATSAAAAAPAAKPGQPKLKSWDYRAWDKFDVDKALEEIDYGASEKPSTQPAEPSTFVNDEAVEEDEVNRIEEALVEKEKGNEYFKRKDFKKAVACYTKSFKLNPDDVTPVVNRALAYLKMKRWTEAESDCTHGLSMQPKNVKALWRRGIARRELGKLEEAMAAVLEPTNASVKEELNAVEKSIEAKNQASKPVPAKPAQSEPVAEKPEDAKPAAPRRRRLEIQEVGDPSLYVPPSVKADAALADQPSKSTAKIDNGPKSDAASQQPISPAPVSLKPEPAASADAEKEHPKAKIEPAQVAALDAPAPPATPPSDAKPADPAAPNRQEPPKSAPTLTPKSAPASPSSRTTQQLVPGVPKTMYEFERDWKSLKNDNAGLYAYLRAIPAASLPRIFQRSLESHYVSKMLEIMSEFYIENDSRRVLCDAMIAMTRIERFSMATMFLSKSDKQAAANLVAHLAADGSDIPAGEIEQIKKAFKVK